MVPGLALEGLDPDDVARLLRAGVDEPDLALLREDEQHALVREEQHLAGAVAALLPDALAVAEIHARQDPVVEPERVAAVHDEVVERGLEPLRGPLLGDRPL